MKLCKIVAILIFLSQSIHAQTPVDVPMDDFIKSLENVEWVIIESHQTISLESNNSNNLIIPGYNEIEKDLKFTENKTKDAQGYFVFKKGDNLIIRDLRNRGTSTTLFLPKDQNIKVKSLGLQNIYVTNFIGDIEAQALKTGHITLKDCNGSVIINTNMGNIRIFFETVKLVSSISAISSSGHIKLVISKGTSANVDLETGTGRVQSDFKINGRTNKAIGEKVKGIINDGGPKILFATTFGNIILSQTVN